MKYVCSLPLSHTRPPEQLVSYKGGQNRKVTADITFLWRQISGQENQFRWIDFHKMKLARVCPAQTELNEFQG